METYIKTQNIISRLKETGGRVLTHRTLATLFPQLSRQGRYETIQRMLDNKTITKVVNGIYEINDMPLTSFERAQVINPKSYISLESALNYFGILAQFPLAITSVTCGRTKTVENVQTYSYIHIKPELFHDYEKINGVLIATREKALIDYLYLASKGLRNSDISEFDLSEVDRTKLKKYPWSQKYAK